MRRLSHVIPLLFAASLWLTGCAPFIELREQYRQYGQDVRSVRGTLVAPACEACSIVVIVLSGHGEALSYRVFERDGPFDIVVSRQARGLFAFQDLNANLLPDAVELSARHTWPADAADPVLGARLELQATAPGAEPLPRGDLATLRNQIVAGVNVQLGTVVTLDDARFNLDQSALGVWQPVTFLRNELAGIYFLEPYSPHKTPVVFVHGMYGSPRDFEALVGRLDRSRYQPWLVYYPSGLRLPALAGGLLTGLNGLWAEHRFKDVHLVAHSMGGLVTRAFLQTCREERECDYVRSFTSMSTPFDGMETAHAGVTYSPLTMPVWYDLDPQSHFIRTLFDAPLPLAMEHHMMVSYVGASTLALASSDGTVPVSSQLRPAAQAQASSVLGVHADHMGILSSHTASERLAHTLSVSTRPAPGR